MLKAISIVLPFIQAHNQQATDDEIVVCFIVPWKNMKQWNFKRERATRSRGKLKDPSISNLAVNNLTAIKNKDTIHLILIIWHIKGSYGIFGSE